MKHLFVSYALALTLKEKGFDEPCFGWYTETYKELLYSHPKRHRSHDLPTKPLSAPLYQQVFDWFRISKKIRIDIMLHDREDIESWKFEISKLGEYDMLFISTHDNTKVNVSRYYKTFEEACNEAVKQALNLIK